MKFTVTDESLNSYGFWIKTSGIEVESFSKNPIMLWNHSRSCGSKTDILPIGKWENLSRQDATLTAEAVFDENDDFAKRIKSKVEQGIVSASSIGIRILAVSEALEDLKPGQQRPTVIRCELREISVCDIPSNSNAVTVQLYDNNDNVINLSDGESHLPLIQNNNNMNFEDVKKELGLSGTSSESEVLTAIQNLKQTQSDALAKIKQQQEESLSAIITDAIKKGKTTESKRETYLSIGRSQGIEVLQSILSDLSCGIRPSQLINPRTGADAPQKWTELSEKEKEDLRRDDKEAYRKLFTAEYGITPEI